NPVTSAAMRPRWIVVAATLTVLVPGIAIAASSPLGKTQQKNVVQDFPGGNILTPVDDRIALTTRRAGKAQRLSWTSGGPWQSDVFYRVYRHDGPGPDTQCVTSGGTAWYCILQSTPIATTRDLTFVDPSPPPDSTYRIGVGTNWIDDPEAGDVFAFTPPVSAAG